MFVLEFLPYGRYSTTFQFTEDATRPLYGEGHKFFTIGGKKGFQYDDFVDRSNTTVRPV